MQKNGYTFATVYNIENVYPVFCIRLYSKIENNFQKIHEILDDVVFVSLLGHFFRT